MTNYLVDSNILVYLIDSTDNERHSKALVWFESINKIDLKNYFISSQNLREFSAVLLKKSLADKSKISEWIREYSSVFNVINDAVEDILVALDLQSKEFPFYDALLVATMKRHGLNIILTENIRDFKQAKDIRAKSIF